MIMAQRAIQPSTVPELVPDAVSWSLREDALAVECINGPLRIATCNLAHGRGGAPHQMLQTPRLVRRNLDRVAEALRDRRVHVAALQEVDSRNWSSGGFDHLRYVAQACGAAYAVLGAHVTAYGLRYGTALLSRLPLHDPRSARFVGSRFRPGKGVCSATVSPWPACTIRVHAVHLDFLSARFRRRQLTQIGQTCTGCDVVAGDFNARWQDRDHALRDFCAEHGLQAWRPEDAGPATFLARGWRIDWIFCSRGLRFERMQVEDRRLSDHRMVVMEVARDE